MENTYTYSAFISYRHLEPDMTVAKKLHTLIETYHIPKAVKVSSGKNKMGRVFRDQDELPLSTDLGSDITQALKNSEWLIVICSPQLLESKWCLTEIDTFIKLGKRDHILAVLVSGSPQESFPEQLRYLDRNGKRVEIEPLAANIVDSSHHGMMKKLKSESLRIFAPMLKVSYDSLKQRDRERRLQTILLASLSALVLVVAFSLYAITQNQIITKQKDTALRNQSLYLSDMSTRTLAEGDRMLAMLLAMEALPNDPANPNRPLVDEAILALRNSISASGGGQDYQAVTEINGHVDSYGTTDQKIAVFDKNNEKKVSLFDISTGKNLSSTLSYAINNNPVAITFTNTLSPLVIYQDQLDFLNGSSVTIYNLPQGEWNVVEGGFGFAAYDLSQGLYLKYQAFRNLYTYNGLHISCATPLGSTQFSNDESVYLIGGNCDEDSSPVLLVQAGYHTGSDNIIASYNWQNYDFKGLRQDGNKKPNVKLVDASPDGLVVMGAENNFIYLWDRTSGNLAQVLHIDLFDKTAFSDVIFSPAKSTNQLAILTSGGDRQDSAGAVWIYDYVKNEVVSKLDSGLARIKSIRWNTDGTKLLCACSDNCARIFDATTGELITILTAGFDLDEAIYSSNDEYGRTKSDAIIVLKSAECLKVFRTGSAKQENIQGISVDLPNTSLTNITFSADGKTIWATDLSSIQSYSSPYLLVFDGKTGEQLASIDAFASKFIPLNNQYMLAYSNTTYGDQKAHFTVYDTATLTAVAEGSPTYPHIFTMSDGTIENRTEIFNIDNVSFSADGSIMIFNAGTVMSNRVDSCVFAYDTKTWQQLWYIGINDPADQTSWNLPFENELKNKLYLKATFVGSSNQVAVTYYDKTTSVVEIRDGRKGSVTGVYHHTTYRTDLMNAKEDRMASINQDNTLQIFTLSTGQKLGEVKLDYSINLIQWLSADTLQITVINDTDENKEKSVLLYQVGNLQAKTLTADQILPNLIDAAAYGFKSVYNTSTFHVSNYSFPYAGYTATLQYGKVIDTETGKALLTLANEDEYVEIKAATSDGNALIVLRTDNGSGKRLTILRNASAEVLLQTAKHILNGRTLTDAERQRFFINAE